MRAVTDITVRPLDLTQVGQAMTGRYLEDHPELRALNVTVKVAGDYGLVDTPRGAFVFSTEGVGFGPLADDDTFRLYGFVRRPSDLRETAVTVAILRELATGEPVNLAAFISTGTASLDRNYESLVQLIQE